MITMPTVGEWGDPESWTQSTVIHFLTLFQQWNRYEFIKLGQSGLMLTNGTLDTNGEVLTTQGREYYTVLLGQALKTIDPEAWNIDPIQHSLLWDNIQLWSFVKSLLREKHLSHWDGDLSVKSIYLDFEARAKAAKRNR